MIQPVGKPPEVSLGILLMRETPADGCAGTRLIVTMTGALAKGNGICWQKSCGFGRLVGVGVGMIVGASGYINTLDPFEGHPTLNGNHIFTSNTLGYPSP